MSWKGLMLGVVGAAMILPGVVPGAPTKRPEPPTAKQNEPASLKNMLQTTGKLGPGLQPLEQVMVTLMHKHQCPGGALAVSKAGRLVVMRGYGYAATGKKIKVLPDHTRFNIASCSKSLTALTLLRLVDQGKLKVTDMVVDRLPKAALPTSGMPAAFKKVTIGMVMRHVSGLPDGPRPTSQLVQKLGVHAPLNLYQMVRASLMYPLAYPPGTKAVYSNLGYDVLGAVAANVSGANGHAVPGLAATDPDNQKYEDAVNRLILQPAGITDALTENLTRAYETNEAHYYFPNGSMQPKPSDVPFNTACGGWCLTAVDMVRFLTKVDGTRGGGWLSQATFTAMLTRAPNNSFRSDGTWFGLGWDVVWPTPANAHAPVGNNWSKDGIHAANYANFGHLAPDIDWAMVVNGGSNTGSIDAEMGNGIAGAVKKIQSWPNVNYF